MLHGSKQSGGRAVGSREPQQASNQCNDPLIHFLLPSRPLLPRLGELAETVGPLGDAQPDRGAVAVQFADQPALQTGRVSRAHPGIKCPVQGAGAVDRLSRSNISHEPQRLRVADRQWTHVKWNCWIVSLSQEKRRHGSPVKPTSQGRSRVSFIGLHVPMLDKGQLMAYHLKCRGIGQP